MKTDPVITASTSTVFRALVLGTMLFGGALHCTAQQNGFPQPDSG